MQTTNELPAAAGSTRTTYFIGALPLRSLQTTFVAPVMTVGSSQPRHGVSVT